MSDSTLSERDVRVVSLLSFPEGMSEGLIEFRGREYIRKTIINLRYPCRFKPLSQLIRRFLLGSHVYWFIMHRDQLQRESTANKMYRNV
jgi:hypothetical protein